MRSRCLLAITVTLFVALIALVALVVFPSRANAASISPADTNKAYMLVYVGNNGGAKGGRYLYVDDEGAIPADYEYDTWAGPGGFIGRVVSAKTHDAMANDGRFGNFVCPLYEVTRTDWDTAPDCRSHILYTPSWVEVLNLVVNVNADYGGNLFDYPWHLGGAGSYTKSNYYASAGETRFPERTGNGIKAYIDRDEGNRFSMIRYYAMEGPGGIHAWSAVNEHEPNYWTDNQFVWSFEGRSGFPLFNFFNVQYDKNSSAATGTMATQTNLMFAHVYNSSASDQNYERRYKVANCGFSRTGYTFDGYKLDGARTGNGKKFNVGDVITTGRSNNSENTVDVNPDTTITMKAQWKANTYRVNFNSNKPADAEHNVGGSTAGIDATYDTAFNAPSCGYTLRGWTFAGWNTKADGTGTTYRPGASVSNLTATNGATVTLYARWTRNMGGASLTKIDADTSSTTASGDATLAGAKVEIVSACTHDITVDVKTVRPGEVATTITTNASGAAATASKLLPSGFYTARESSPSTGYLLNSSWGGRFEVVDDGRIVSLDGTLGRLPEDVVRGRVSVNLHDADGMDAAQGDATFAGATLDVVNRSAASVKVGGRMVAPGEVVLTLTTDENGRASTDVRALPYGTYDVVPTSPSRGYTHSSPKATVSVREDGADVGTDFNETLIRSSLRAEKLDAVTGRTVQGDATFEGAAFGVRVESAHAVKIHGVDGADHVYQPGDVIPSSVTGLVTGSDGIASCGALLPWADASLVVVEESAPAGYLKGDDAVRITANGGRAYVSGYDTTHVPGGTSLSADVATISDYASGTNGTFISATKQDAETSGQQGDGTLAGAVLTVTNASRSIVHVTFDEDGNPHPGRNVAPGELVCRIVTNASGYARTGTVPYGSYDVREIVPPVGMHLNTEWEARLQTYEDNAEFTCTVYDQSFRSGVSVRKIDSSFWGDISGGLPEHTLDFGQGDATFAGAVFEVYNVGRAPVLVNGRMIRPATYVTFDETLARAGESRFLSEVSSSTWIPDNADVALTLTCDANGRCASDANALPYGTYVIREVKAPQGYVLNPDWGRGTVFAVRNEGKMIDLHTLSVSGHYTNKWDEPVRFDLS